MVKQSKNLGFRKACPHDDCRKLLIKTLNVEGAIMGKVVMEMLCPKCGKKVTVKVGQRTYVEVVKTMAIVIAVVLATGGLFFSIATNQNLAFLIKTYVPEITP